MKITNRSLACIAFVFALTLFLSPRDAAAYVEAPMSLGAVITQSTNIVLMKVEKVDKTQNLIIYRKVQDLKGKHPTEVIKHNIGRGGFHPREWQITMDWAEAGKTAVFFHNGGASETCINNYWYQAYAGGEWWNMSHAEPFLLRSFAGNPDKLAPAVTAILGGQEVLVPCMQDGDKNTLQLRTAKVQRMKASLKIQDYDQKRDFAGWGGEDFRLIAGMPAFSHYTAVSGVGPGPLGVSWADFDGDGKPGVCLYGTNKVVLLQNAGTSFNEVSLPARPSPSQGGATGSSPPYEGGAGGVGARAAIWADYNGDGKPDLFLATPSGPRLLTNQGGKFRDDTSLLPKEAYYNLTAAAWLDYDGDGKPDLLLANGFLGLRLYRNKGLDPNSAAPITLGKWHVCGPFSNTGQKGFATEYPPEKEINFKAEYTGKGGGKAVWKEADFSEEAINNLAIFEPERNVNSVAYVYREIDAKSAMELPISLGSDDTLTVWLNGQKLLAENTYRAAAPDQNQLTLKLKQGKNQLLMKICQGDGDFAFYFAAKEPTVALPQCFEDISAKVGLGPNGIGSELRSGHLAVADVNGDGRPDFLYSAAFLPPPLAKGGQAGLLALNTPQGFVLSKESGLVFEACRAAPIFGDFNGDKFPDLLVPQAKGCKLFKNDGKGRFADVTAKAGDLAKIEEQVACAQWVDYDGKGRLDLVIGCLRGTNRFFRNHGDGTFLDASEELGLHQRVFNTRGLAVLDLNKDGMMDLVLNNEGQEPCILLGKSRGMAAK
jgi:hypothetical protein